MGNHTGTENEMVFNIDSDGNISLSSPSDIGQSGERVVFTGSVNNYKVYTYLSQNGKFVPSSILFGGSGHHPHISPNLHHDIREAAAGLTFKLSTSEKNPSDGQGTPTDGTINVGTGRGDGGDDDDRGHAAR